MHPAKHLESYLHLVETLEKKINRIKNSVGTDQSILGEDANPIEFTEGLYTDEKTASDTFAKLTSDDSGFLSEDAYIGDLRVWEKVATDEDRARVQNIAKGKWGYFPMAARHDPKSPPILSLMRATLEGSISKMPSHAHLFISVDSDFRAAPITSIEALSYLRTTLEENQVLPDRMVYERTSVARLCSRLAEQKATEKPSLLKDTP